MPEKLISELHASEFNHPVYLSEQALLAECRLRLTRASGPGGQHRNKVETAVELVHLPTSTVSGASEKRNQRENREVALMRLRILLATNVRSKVNPAFRAYWDKYLQKTGLVNISETNSDWPILLAEVLNLLAVNGWDLPPVAEQLQTTTSQLVKLLKKNPASFRKVNHERSSLGKAPLKA